MNALLSGIAETQIAAALGHLVLGPVLAPLSQWRGARFGTIPSRRQQFAFSEKRDNEYPHIELALDEQQRVPGV